MKLFWRRKQTDPEQLRLGTIMFDAMVRKNDWEKSVIQMLNPDEKNKFSMEICLYKRKIG